MPTLATIDGHRIDTPPGIRQRDIDAEHEALVGLGLVIRAAAEQVFATGARLDQLTLGVPTGRQPVDQLAQVIAEGVADATCLNSHGFRSLMAGVR